jgi:hypothetical protein
MSFLGGIAIVMISIETIRETNASTTETAVQDPRDLILLFCYYIITLGTYVTIVGRRTTITKTKTK